MTLTIVRIKENFNPWHGGGHQRSPVGEVGYLIEDADRIFGRLKGEQEVAVQTFKIDGSHGATYYHVPATAIEQTLDRDWYDAFIKYYDKPYIEISLDFMVAPASAQQPSYGIWLHVGKDENKYRLVGGETYYDANQLVGHWDSVAMRMGLVLVVDPYVQALCLDYQEGDRRFGHYHRMWAENVLRVK